jgi:type II secretory pathway component GspD/PulD (secretin)
MFLRLFFLLILLAAWVSAAEAQNSPSKQNPSNEVTLEANAVQVVLNDEHRGGVDWGAIVSDFHTAPLKIENGQVWSDKKRLNFGTLSQDDYEVLLDALDMAGKVSQSPQTPVKTVLGTPAVINFEKQNIHVNVLLTRLKSGDLSLRIGPAFAVAATEIWDGERVPSSVVLQSETKMQIAVNSTVVIGGFMTEQEMKRTRRFPLLGNISLLGDIPIVGLVFRSQGRLMQKTETVIFVTVRANAVEAPEEDTT